MRDYLSEFLTAGIRNTPVKARVTLTQIEISENDRRMFNRIIEAVVLNFDVTALDLQKKQKQNGQIKATRTSITLLREHTTLSFGDIAGIFRTTKGNAHYSVAWIKMVLDKSQKMPISAIDRKQLIEKITSTKKHLKQDA